MTVQSRIATAATVAWRLARYNVKIIFSGKFPQFLGGALAFYLIIGAIIVLNTDTNPNEGSVYTLLMIPGLLLIFYPITFGLQNDIENRMIEILFGIPNYRFSVWLVRIALVFGVALAILAALSALSTVLLTPVPVLAMTFQLAFPVVFLGTTAFLVTTFVPSGSGASVVMVILGVAALVLLHNHPRWNPFLNPFVLPDTANEAAWREIVTFNRIALAGGTALALMGALLNLQKRERFLG